MDSAPLTLTLLLRRQYVRQYLDRRWPLHTHVVICGFPRSGTTLLHLMIAATVRNATTFSKERNALAIGGTRTGRGHPWLITKRPNDLLRLDRIREQYRAWGDATKVRFLICTRDPRAVLTSRHRNATGYYVSAGRWMALAEAFDREASAADVRVVEFADVIMQPDRVQDTLTDWLGWHTDGRFADAHQHVPAHFDTAALNGVRPLDTNRLTAWCHQEHGTRLKDIHAALPNFTNWLHAHGYMIDSGSAGRF
jgi:hypothetical protein